MQRTNFENCLRILGLAPGASWEEIRQAYLDLVRVWHPDRFQLDSPLRKRAERQLQKINAAYAALKDSKYSHSHPATPGRAAPPPAPPPVRPSSSRPLRESLLHVGPFSRGIVITGACAAPFLMAGILTSYLRLALPALPFPESRMGRPAILTPSRILSPLSDVQLASETLAAWARGEGIDLWRASPQSGAAPPSPPPAGRAPHSVRPRLHARAGVLLIPENGAEILWTRSSGVGELRIANRTHLDALATLVQAGRDERMRAVYIKSQSRVHLQNVAVGVYDLLAELGSNWDSGRLHFRAEQRFLGRVGPLAYYSVTSAQGSSGSAYDVVLRIR